MKKYLILLLGLLVTARAASTSNSSFADQTVTIQNGDCEIAFWISWWADDYPQNSAPGRLALLDGTGALVGSVVASHYRDSGLSISASAGAVDGLSSNVGRFCPNGTPADGFVAGTWRLSGLPPDTYTLQSWSYATFDTMLSATGVWTDTYVIGVSATPPPPPPPPTPEPPPPPPPEPPPPPPPVEYSLTTSASSGGSVSAGGLFPAGSILGVSAAPDTMHYFAGWSGDATGNSPATTVYLDGDRWVFAQFYPKTAQAISFAAPSNQPVGAPALPLSASSTSGLPVQISVVSGPATIADNILTITGPGTVTLQATQPGDGMHLPANPVLRSFSVSAPSVVRYQTTSRTLLANAEPGSHFVLRITP